jgi:alkyl sulfatase BDS1-like metallo-beta-lactamase superfamily hydrolase
MRNASRGRVAVAAAMGTILFVAIVWLRGAVEPTGTGDAAATKGAEPATRKILDEARDELPWADRQDFEDARRGFVATLPDVTISNADGRIVWSLKQYAFVAAETPPATVHPSLWRQAQLNMNNGLFKVAERIYQVRAFDLSNMDLIEGDTGLIIVDPLISAETARAALALYRAHRPDKPVVAVIYTHSHVDHYGGVRGVVDEADVKSGKVKIFAPAGFLEHAVSENVMAGNAMSRRATYMYGALLPKGERGQVDAGLGKTTSLGTVTLIPPTDSIAKTGERRTIDGIEFVFQMAYETEAPSEMLMYLPQFRALCAAEDATHTLHNLYTLRGAEVRNAKAWWKTLNEAVELFGDKTDVVFAQHHWPTWERERCLTFLKKQRDLYKYIHDQSLRLMNQGYTMNEIAETLRLPPQLARVWYNRGYYGSTSHDSKAVYQRYLGWYDSNPAHLNPLPPQEAATHYVEFMGGAEAVIAKARESFAAGQYRWVAEVLNHVVFADPANAEARRLEADALEQLGYQTENTTWRNEYLMAAFELRNGVPRAPATRAGSPDTVRAMTLDMFFDYMGVRLNGPKADGKAIAINWVFTDTGQKYVLSLEDSVLVYTADKQLENPDATVTLERAALDDVVIGKTTLDKALADGRMKIDGQRAKLVELMSLLDTFDPMFNIVTP